MDKIQSSVNILISFLPVFFKNHHYSLYWEVEQTAPYTGEGCETFTNSSAECHIRDFFCQDPSLFKNISCIEINLQQKKKKKNQPKSKQWGFSGFKTLSGNKVMFVLNIQISVFYIVSYLFNISSNYSLLNSCLSKHIAIIKANRIIQLTEYALYSNQTHWDKLIHLYLLFQRNVFQRKYQVIL